MPPATILFLRGDHHRHPQLDTLRQHTCLDVAPECDQKFSGHCHDGDPACATLQSADTLAEPGGKCATWLITQPQPGELNERCACPLIARAADAAIKVHATALVGHRCYADVAGELAPIGERAV